MRQATHIIYIVLLWTALLTLCPHISRAQNNFYKVDDECYAIMSSMNMDDKEHEYMRKAKEMYDLAVKKGDAKAQTLAVSSILTYYDNQQNLKKVREYAEKLRQEAKRTGYSQYYYFAYNREIENLLFINMEEAMRLAKQMTKEADNDPEPYGRFLSYQQLGNVYKARNNKRLSRQYYEKALEVAPLLATKQRTSAIYVSLAELTENYTLKMRLCDKAMEEGMDAADTLRTLNERCMTCGKFKRKDEFMRYYNQAEEILPRVHMGGGLEVEARAYKAAFDGNYTEAYKILERDKSKQTLSDRLIVGETIATWQGNGKKALGYAMSRERHNDNIFVSHRGYEFAELTDIIVYESLREEQARQEIQRAQMMLESQNLLTELKEMDEHNKLLLISDAQIERRNRQAATLNRQYEDSLRNANAEREYIRNTIMQNQQDNIRTMFHLIAAVLIIVIAIFIVIMLSYRRTSRSLLRHAKELRKARTEALEAAEMKNVFIQNMSHEIRTPLNAVMGFSQLMAVPGLPMSEEEKVEYTQHILNNSKMLTMLVDDILNIAEIEKGNYSITPSSCLANEIMADAISTAEYRAQPGVRVYYTSDVDDHYTIYTDGRRVQQVLINFLTNACKHTEEGSIHLHLSVNDTQSLLTYSVTDTGCGIPADQAENIFERFTKLNDFKQGTGLGLNICRLIATKMGGKVYCDTSYTTGARFVFEVPLTQPDEKQA